MRRSEWCCAQQDTCGHVSNRKWHCGEPDHVTGRRVRKWIYWAEHGAGMLPHCHGGLGDTNPDGEKTLGQEKICHNCLPLLLRLPLHSRPPVKMYLWGWQKPIFGCTDPPWRGATCLNKTNKSGGPKDVADACCLPPGPSQTKMLSLSEWREWMGTMSDQPPPGSGDTRTLSVCHRSGHSHTINQTKLIQDF